jgi:hypothetical protein
MPSTSVAQRQASAKRNAQFYKIKDASKSRRREALKIEKANAMRQRKGASGKK